MVEINGSFYNFKFFSLRNTNMKTGGKGTNKDTKKDTKKDDYNKGGKGSGTAKGGKGK